MASSMPAMFLLLQVFLGNMVAFCCLECFAWGVPLCIGLQGLQRKAFSQEVRLLFCS